MPPPGPPVHPGRVRLAIACIIAMGVAVWWMVGDLYEPMGAALLLTEPPALPPAVEHGVGLVALCTVVVALGVLASNKEQRDRERRWRAVFVALLLIVAPMAGFGWRVATARELGGNIGAGLFLIYGLPVGGVVTLWAALRAESLVRVTVPDQSSPPT